LLENAWCAFNQFCTLTEQGVRAGDKILEVNGTDFKQMSHAEAVTLMRNAWNVIMKVQSAASQRQGKSANHIEDT
jgi:C-terminal processing protease CtpA/Prc